MNKFVSRITVLSLVGALSLTTACTTQNAYTGEDQTASWVSGAGIGALSGAAIGALTTSDRSKGAARGALIGAALGGGYGAYMDAQEAELRKELVSTGVQVKKVGDNINLVMPSNITFATDSADINAGFYKTLDSVAKVIAKFDKTYVAVLGHTDSTGGDMYNMTLSQKRAHSVSAYLSARGVAGNRISAQGYGETMPIMSNSTAAGREANRRVEIKLVPMGK
ncbi:MAG: OmpA family protein [Alphaproteobacteria bacterium]|jgi:outer membrane protein OmpA-like peptidoglycan-associated protein|nr:OmpA family protein [Alphaproteobacteria bacterium]